jgi:TolB-like protein/tetratricopeptide (TPR) repeat protein
MRGAEQRAASIAVAPFREPPRDPDHALLANGFLEDVIAELARFPNFEVLAARTSLSLPAEQLEPVRMAERFGTTHLLDSSVLAKGDALQVKANLIEAPSGRQLWNQHYQVPLRELFAVQNDIAAHVANQMSAHIEMTRLARARTRPIASLEAYDCWLRGRDCLRRGTLAADGEAREFFERALSIDPTYARGYAGLSLTHANEWSCQLWSNWQENERLAHEYARRASELDGTDHTVHAVLARIHIFRRNFGQARTHLDRALALSPNDADTLIQVALWTSYLGEGERAAAMVDKALRLNPLHDAWYYAYGWIPFFFARELDRGLLLAEMAPPNMMVDQSAFMAAAYAHRGDLERARPLLAEFLREFQQKITFGRTPEPDEPLRFLLHVNPFAREQDADYLLDGLRKAGWTVARSGTREAYLPPGPAESGRFSLDGDQRVASFAGRTVRIGEIKGCRDLAMLLSSPNERIHCMEIAGRMSEGHAGAALDARARAECQRRLRELREELADAEASHDLGRQQAARAELDGLTEQLGAALGLFGRARKLGDPAEKARTAVTWRIRNAIKKIGEAHPELGRHLEVSIRTGAFCAYSPEKAIDWTV